MLTANRITGSEFLLRFRAGLLAVWLLPLGATFPVVGFLGDHSFEHLLHGIKHLTTQYTVVCLVAAFLVLDRSMRKSMELATRSDDAAIRAAERRVARFPLQFAALFIPYALFLPVVLNICLGLETGERIELADHLFGIIGIAPAAAVASLIALYVFSDLVGQYFGPLGLRTHFFSLRMKVAALGIVMPLVVDTVLILYFGHKNDAMGLEMFLTWLFLFAVSLPVAYFAQLSFNRSFAPLRKLRSQALNVLDDPDSIIDPVPVSLDEFGDITRDWTSLTRRMTRYWQELQNTTEHYKAVIDAIDEAIAIVDDDLKALFLGTGFTEWLSDTPETFIGRSVVSLIHDEDHAQFLDLAEHARAWPQERPEGQVRMRHPDGTYRRVLCCFRRIKLITGKDALFISMRDLTSQLRAQERLRAGEIRLRTMMESIADGILSIDENCIIQSVNPAASRLFGYEDDKLVGCSASLVLPDALSEAFRNAQGIGAGEVELERLVGRGALEIVGRRKNGDTFPMEVAVTEMWIASERFFVSAVRDISKQKKSEAELRQALNDAEAANRTKSLFLANMSHELRTPLNAVIGFSEVMKSEMFGPMENERYAEYVGSIHDSSRHLLSVINDILDISRIESGELELDEEWVGVDEVLAWARDRASPGRSGTGDAAVHVAVNPGLPDLLADRRSLRQIVLNLLSNALKFTPPDGEIHLSAWRNELSGVSIAVSDTGIGIPADQVDKMTQPFTQSDNSLARRYEGTGLGLAITQSLVEAHGGRLTIESVEGEGTTVTVRMPANRVWSEAAEQVQQALKA